MGRAARSLGLMPADPADAWRAIGILGGTFDPVHVGHLALAREAHRVLELGAGPLRAQRSAAAQAIRRGQLGAASRGHAGAGHRDRAAVGAAFALSRIELERAGPSYAVDTVAELAAQSHAEGRPEPWFILSAEVLDDFHTWREPSRILELCRVAVSPRLGADPLDRAWLSEHYPGREDRFAFLPGPMLDVASTTIRSRVAAGLPIDGLVPPAVARYIEEAGLYRAAVGEAS